MEKTLWPNRLKTRELPKNPKLITTNQKELLPLKIQYGTLTALKRVEVKRSYIFTNTGKGDLQIRSAQASCGCTSPNWSKDPIPPGGTGFVDAKFNSTDRGGPDGIANEKKITVTFENSTQETIELKFKATVFSKKGKESDSDHNNH